MSYLPIDATGNDNTIDGNLQVNSLNGGSIDGVAATAQALNDGARADLGTFLTRIDETAVSSAGGVISTLPAVNIATHPNLTREAFGKGAVHPNAGTISNRKDILLNDQQSDEEIALSIISALEFTDGLSTVQSMTDNEVTSLTQPDLDVFENYPESMFNNAAQLNTEKETFVFDAIAASTDATQAFTSYQ
jgi:hypothetical protein